MHFLEVAGISKKEQKGDILQNISFQQEQFQKIAIAGETGSGKSTLLKIIAGLLQPDAGKVFLEGDRVFGPAEQLVAGHPEIAYLSQHFELPEFLRVEQALRYANTLTAQEAEHLYEICQISHLLQRRTDELSGGEKQRIALTRLLTTSPRLLLLDEPFSNLDTAHKNELKTVIQDLGEQLDITCLLISHDPLDTLSWADEILVMRDGNIQQQGTPEQIYQSPINEYVASLFGKFNLFPPSLATQLKESLKENSAGKSLFVRPENLKVTEHNTSGVSAVVHQITYYGSYHELNLSVKDQLYTARVTGQVKFSSGNRVTLWVEEDFVWYI
ncbi:ABC transporter ATP-binding protein [Rufibacter roseus]|uniref:ABC transporter ATP-binding protein n=1 Tax=Rufibacter roseus TaxID=1567108 RepID=A0ABW2DM85_9BACT|nr:ABC transporter ATP-binding protein [Rufibacter roseus]